MSFRRRSAMTLAALVLGTASSLALVPSTQVAALPSPSVATHWGHTEADVYKRQASDRRSPFHRFLLVSEPGPRWTRIDGSEGLSRDV